MARRKPNPINLKRIRNIPRSFSWIDRRLITDNFLYYLCKDEILLYFFLVTVSDRNGMSFYGREKIQCILNFSDTEFRAALCGLKEKDLVLFRFPFFQVLSLPKRPVLNGAAMRSFLGRDQA